MAGVTWGTTYNITYKSERNLDDSILHCMNIVDNSLSPFVNDSQISLINRNEICQTDTHFRNVFELSQKVCSISNGAFDPTVAPLINLWGFGYKKDATDSPTQEQIDTALNTVGILQCHIDRQDILYKKDQNTEFNFSAIAKGYGVDLIAEMLERNQCSNYMVEIGGEIRLNGQNPRGADWIIQIDAPVNDPLAHEQLVKLHITDCAIATSGNYRNNRMVGDSLIYHTISAATGYPAPTKTLSATIIAPTCAFADALATSTMAIPTDEAIDMLNQIQQIKYLVVTADTIISNIEP